MFDIINNTLVETDQHQHTINLHTIYEYPTINLIRDNTTITIDQCKKQTVNLILDILC